jgi:predicted nucleic acid-binding protein
VRFLDTNVLLYAISHAPDEAARAERALQLLDAADCALSVQVLQEFYVQATRRSKADRIEHRHAVALIESWLRFPVQELTVPVLQAALVCKERYQIGYWDAAIIEAARTAGCRDVLSEDLQDGQDYGGIRVVNPFRGM